jgi:putative ABC transport system permease protein
MKKLFRDIRKSLGQFIAVTVVSAIGVALLTGFSVTYASLNNMADDGYRNANLAGMSAYYLGIDDAGIAKIKAVPGVSDAYGRLTLKASAPDNSSDFLIHTVSADEKIDVPALTSGRLPQSSGECMLDDPYAKAHGLSVGGTVSASVGGHALNFTLTGTFNTSEYIYLVEDPAKDPVPDHKAFGLLYLDKSYISALAGKPLYNEVLISLVPGADENAVKQAVEDATSGYGFGHITLQKDQPS